MQNNFSFGHYNRIIIHTPHAGTELPIRFSNGYYKCIEVNQRLRGEAYSVYKPLTDHYTDKLFSAVVVWPMEGRIKQISFEYSRLFCDVERLENDPLEEKGLGIHYDLNRYGVHINWTLGEEDIMRLYHEHQQKLSRAVAYYRTTLLLDCHSFSERDNILCPNAHESKDIDICLGFNEDETKPSDEFIDSVKNFFAACGYRVEYNKPFSNSKTINPAPEYAVYHSLMIEVNKHCYMNEDTLEITAGYYKLHAELQQLYHLLLKA